MLKGIHICQALSLSEGASANMLKMGRGCQVRLEFACHRRPGNFMELRTCRTSRNVPRSALCRGNGRAEGQPAVAVIDTRIRTQQGGLLADGIYKKHFVLASQAWDWTAGRLVQ